jgi:4-aminobutyrate aminotransferase-like enzyme
MRRIGLMFAFDFDSADRVNRIVNRAKERGIICYWFLSNPHSFRIAPPLTITEDQIRESCAILIECINQA